MKVPILALAVVMCTMGLPVVYAQDSSMPGKPTTAMGAEHQMTVMQANINEMQAQMAKIRATTDPKERQKLMQEHLQTMQANMQMMRGMMTGPMMTNCGQTGGMGMGGGKAMSSADMMQRQHMMEQRADMMQSMMDQMQAHQEAMQTTSAR
jgi:hypothetical protein